MKDIFCLMGPTASGKTALAMALVQRAPFEIVSVDSAMVYRGMNIGTAKPTASELKIAPHHLIDIRDPSENYSAGSFHEDVSTLIPDIFSRGKIPLLVGGTMLYFHVIQQGLADLPSSDATLRKKIQAEGKVIGWEKMHERLKKIDPAAAIKIKPTDPQRIQRALELYELTGKSRSVLWEEQKAPALPYHFRNIVLAYDDRTLLHTKIAERFEKMLADGFLEEVETLYKRGDLHADLPSIRTVGYRQAWDYFSGKITFEEMKERAIIATRQFAKRQYTWLNKWKNNAAWLQSEEAWTPEDVLGRCTYLFGLSSELL